MATNYDNRANKEEILFRISSDWQSGTKHYSIVKSN